jgi:uncharacterized heparinase superfamily protein
LSRLSLYFHTLRHLRPVQFTSRVWMRLHRPSVDLRPAPDLRPVAARFRTPIAGAPSMLGPTTFRLLNEQRRIDSAADWHPATVEKLWLYNLHYFDDLNAADAESRRQWHVALLERWVREVTPGRAEAWEPYPVSRRIVNWIKWALRGNVPSMRVLDSLAAQSRWLMHRLEYHLLANHLFANAKALLFTGLFFTGAEAEAWRKRGLAIVTGELREQVLADGGHFELSPMYHASMLEDLLDLINLYLAFDVPVPASWSDAVERMLRWLRNMSHPDGNISFFNDSAFDIAPDLATLERYAGSLELPPFVRQSEPLQWLRESGYVRACAGPAYLLFDCGEVGPAYQPGHAHADTLSFELSVHGRRLFVNSGTSQYGMSAERQRQRGTAAHNTVVIDGKDSSEVWAGFRVARRAHASVDEVDDRGELSVAAHHDGYRRLPGRNRHHRRWFLRAGALRIVDRIEGSCQDAQAYFHLAPEFRAERTGVDEISITRLGAEAARVAFQGASSIDLEQGTWHPRFGEARQNVRLRVRFSGSELVTHARWAEVA